MRHFLYFEPLTEGHCAAWAQAILASALSNPAIGRVTFCATRALYDRLSDDVDRTGLEFVPIEEDEARHLLTGSALSRSWKQWSKFRRMVRDRRPDICFVPFFDQIAMWASLDRRPLGSRVSGNIFKAPNDFGLSNNYRDFVNKYARWATYICSIRSEVPFLFAFDETLLDTRWPRLANRFRLLRDPAPDTELFEDIVAKGREDGRKTALFFGYISKRKGIFNLLSSLGELSEQEQKTLAIRISGRVKPELLGQLESAIEDARRTAPDVLIELNNKYLTEAEIAQEIVDASVLLMPYEDHVGSSGVLYWAATAGRPVIAQNTRLVGYLVTRYGLGQTVDVWNHQALANALVKDFDLSDDRAAGFIDGNSFEALANRILTELLA